MRQFWKYMGLCLLLCGTACTRENPQPAASAGEETAIAITVAPPEMKGPATKALFPLGPELENPVKNLSLLMFDRENQHRIGHPDYYRHLEYISPSAPDGVLVVPDLKYDGALNKEQDATLCVVANMDEQRLLDAIRREGTGEVISLADFKHVVVDLPYHSQSDSVGLVKNIYMFGYYRGKLVPEPSKADIEISLGRIISRLNISLSVSEGLAKENLQYAIRLVNAQYKAYLFPGDTSPEDAGDDGNFFLAPLGTVPLTYYYYVAPNAAADEAAATQIEIATAPAGEVSFPAPGTVKTASVALCNEPPLVEGGGGDRDYQLNRNCIYNISIRLKKRGETTRTTRSSAPDAIEVEIDIPS